METAKMPRAMTTSVKLNASGFSLTGDRRWEIGDSIFEFRISDFGKNLCDLSVSAVKPRRVSEYPRPPEAGVRMGGEGSEGAKPDSTAEAQRRRGMAATVLLRQGFGEFKRGPTETQEYPVSGIRLPAATAEAGWAFIKNWCW